MSSLRHHEGYILIDHRDSPGVDAVNINQVDTPIVGPGATYESATYTCSHCHRIVVINPKRTRERPYCARCDHRICDQCDGVRNNSVVTCLPMNAILDKALADALKQEQTDKSTIPSPLILGSI